MKKTLLFLVVLAVGLTLYKQYSEQAVPATDQSATYSVSSPMVHIINVTSEQGFIQEMIPHHQEAIDTSQVVLKKTQDPDLQQFTQAVIKVQTQEVAQMKEWLKNWYQVETASDPGYVPMMGDLSLFNGQQQEKLYVEGMIRHHQGAIEMARQVLALNPRPEVKAMAEAIVTVQQAEVQTLQNWLTTKYSAVDAKDPVEHQMNVH